MSIFGRMQLKECLSKACREGRGRFSDSTLGSCKFCSKSRKEVVLSLLRSQDRYRRKYAKCISRQEDYVLSIRSCGYRTNDLLDMVDRIRYTGILGYALVCEINLAFCIQGNVLKQCVSLDSVVDVRLGIFVQVDNLCVAAALEVEYAVVVPAVLVVANQQTLRIGG